MLRSNATSGTSVVRFIVLSSLSFLGFGTFEVREFSFNSAIDEEISISSVAGAAND